MAPEALAQVLRPIQDLFDPADHPDLLVGLGSPDDAAVYRLDADRALIVTTDFFTPIVDDPYDYGAIAAANALSDVYAMGGMPILALNIAALPENLPVEMMTAIMRGSAEKVKESGAVIAGGHTIKDKEPKVGLAVVGIAHPAQLTMKGGAQPGDILILSKPLGTGIITTANKRDQAEADHLAEAVRWMSMLNKHAALAGSAGGAHSMTDITGFGLLGHGLEMADSSGVTLRIEAGKVPFMSGVDGYATQWIFPGGSADNFATFGPQVSFDESISKEKQMLLADAQTSGGLLIALPHGGMDAFQAEMDQAGAEFWVIGEVIERGDRGIVVLS